MSYSLYTSLSLMYDWSTFSHMATSLFKGDWEMQFLFHATMWPAENLESPLYLWCPLVWLWCTSACFSSYLSCLGFSKLLGSKDLPFVKLWNFSPIISSNFFFFFFFKLIHSLLGLWLHVYLTFCNYTTCLWDCLIFKPFIFSVLQMKEFLLTCLQVQFPLVVFIFLLSPPRYIFISYIIVFQFYNFYWVSF